MKDAAQVTRRNALGLLAGAAVTPVFAPAAQAHSGANRVVRKKHLKDANTSAIEGEGKIEPGVNLLTRSHACERFGRMKHARVAKRNTDVRALRLGRRDFQRTRIAAAKAKNPDRRGRAILTEEFEHQRIARIDRTARHAKAEANARSAASPQNWLFLMAEGHLAQRTALR